MRLYMESYERPLTVGELRRMVNVITPGDDDIPVFFREGRSVKYVGWESAPNCNPDAKFVIG